LNPVQGAFQGIDDGSCQGSLSARYREAASPERKSGARALLSFAGESHELSGGLQTAEALREEAIRELRLIKGFQAEVFDPYRRRWCPGFAVRSEFPRPTARELHAVALRRRGFTNEEIGKVLRVQRSRVTILAWRGEGFLLSVQGELEYEDTRREGLRRL
jgi:hypothetical protein